MKRSNKIVAAAMVALSALMAQSAPQNGVLPMNYDREAVLKFFEENVYGVRPKFEGFVPKAEIVKEERIAEIGAVRKMVAINTMTPIGEKTFKATAYFPEGKGAVPVFVMPGFHVPYREFNLAWKGKVSRWPVNDILARGCGTVSFDYNDVLKDDPHVLDGVGCDLRVGARGEPRRRLAGNGAACGYEPPRRRRAFAPWQDRALGRCDRYAFRDGEPDVLRSFRRTHGDAQPWRRDDRPDHV